MSRSIAQTNSLKNRSFPKDEKRLLFAVVGFLFAFQIFWHVYLWINDFNALSIDAYLRLYFAASWAKYPKLFIPDAYLPFYSYIYGTVIKLLGNIIWTGRILTLFFSVLFSIYFLKLTAKLTENKFTGILALPFVFSSTLFMRITTVALSEIVAFFFIIFSLYHLLEWRDCLENENPKGKNIYANLLLCELSLFIGNGLRYECWLVTLVSSLFVVFVLFKNRKKIDSFSKLFLTALILCIPFIIPPLWFLIERSYFERSTKFIPRVSPSEQSFSVTNLFFYVKFLVVYYPALLLLFFAGFPAIREYFKKFERVLFFALLLVFLGFLFIVGLKFRSHHRVLPERTLLFFILFLAPVTASALTLLVDKFKRVKKPLVYAVTAIVGITCIASFVKFLNLPSDPFPVPKKVGKYLRKLDRSGKIPKPGNILVEKSPNDWAVIYVESNLLGRTFFDRKSFFGKPMVTTGSELLKMTGAELAQTAKEAKLVYLVFKDQNIIDFLKKHLDITEETKIDNYSVLKVKPFN